MKTEVAVSPVQIENNYLDLNCPATGQPCPSRVHISRLCAPQFDSSLPSAEVLEASRDDSIKETGLLLGHTGLINMYGCAEGPVEGQCPPSLESNKHIPVRGLKKFIKKRLGK